MGVFDFVASPYSTDIWISKEPDTTAPDGDYLDDDDDDDDDLLQEIHGYDR